MANVTTGVKSVEKITVVQEPTYTLTLSATEAKMVQALVGRVGGDGDYRTAAGSVYRALVGARVGEDAIYLLEGNIKFKKSSALTW